MNTTANRTVAEMLQEPVETELAKFMAECSDDPETRDTMVSTLVLSLWQMGARGNKVQLPSMILINAGGEDDDPLLSAVHKISQRTKDELEGIRSSGHFAGGTPDKAPDAMFQAFSTMRQHQSGLGCFEPRTDLENYYHSAREAAYGRGDMSPYTGAWDPKLGLVTDLRNSILLLLNTEEDWEAFRHDLEHEPKKIEKPTGIGQQLMHVDKTLALSGTIRAEQFDEGMLDAVLELGLPLLFMPHTCSESINIPNPLQLAHFVYELKRIPKLFVCNFSHLPEDKWVRYYQNWIWQRLSLLPAEYRFGMMETVHQLQGVCEQLAIYSYDESDIDRHTKEIEVLTRNLFTTVLRSIALSLAFLAWHGHGIKLSCSIRSARKLLTLLREDGGSMSLRDVQRGAGFGSAAKRDEVLQQLEDQGLVTLDDNLVSATTMNEFIGNIREQLPVA
jgi:hypothetical protein